MSVVYFEKPYWFCAIATSEVRLASIEQDYEAQLNVWVNGVTTCVVIPAKSWEVARRMFDDIVNIHIEQDVTWSFHVNVDSKSESEWVRSVGRPAPRGEWAA